MRSRPALLLAACLALSQGCHKAEIEAGRAGIQKLRQELEGLADTIQGAEHALSNIRKTIDRMATTKKGVDRELDQVQEALAMSWHGHASTMKQRARRIPSELTQSLKAAQDKFGGASTENTFLLAVQGSDLQKAANVLTDIEPRAGLSMPMEDEVPEGEGPDQEPCECPPVGNFECARIPAIADSRLKLLCSAWFEDETSAAFLIGLQDGMAVRWEITGKNRGGYRLKRALGPGAVVLEALNEDGKAVRLVLVAIEDGRLTSQIRLRLKSLTANLISGYNRDVQLTKGPLMRALDATRDCLEVMTLVVSKMSVDAKRCEAALTPEIFATQEAYKLVEQGMPFRDAYRTIAGRYSGK